MLYGCKKLEMRYVEKSINKIYCFQNKNNQKGLFSVITRWVLQFYIIPRWCHWKHFFVDTLSQQNFSHPINDHSDNGGYSIRSSMVSRVEVGLGRLRLDTTVLQPTWQLPNDPQGLLELQPWALLSRPWFTELRLNPQERSTDHLATKV